jgi:hypothetical protein
VKIGLVRSGVSKAGIVGDDLWELIEPLLPPWPDKPPGPWRALRHAGRWVFSLEGV